MEMYANGIYYISKIYFNIRETGKIHGKKHTMNFIYICRLVQTISNRVGWLVVYMQYYCCCCCFCNQHHNHGSFDCTAYEKKEAHLPLPRISSNFVQEKMIQLPRLFNIHLPICSNDIVSHMQISEILQFSRKLLLDIHFCVHTYHTQQVHNYNVCCMHLVACNGYWMHGSSLLSLESITKRFANNVIPCL